MKLYATLTGLMATIILQAAVCYSQSVTPVIATFDFPPSKEKTQASEVTEEVQKANNAISGEEVLFNKIAGTASSAKTEDTLAACLSFKQRFPQSKHLPKVKLIEGYCYVKSGSSQGAIQHFKDIADNYPDTNEGGEAALRCAYLKTRLKHPADDCLKAFESVALGKVQASKPVKDEAMLRCAAIYHKKKDLPAAEAMYSKVVEECNEPGRQAFAHLQLAGLAMEKTWNGKATFKQARELCDELPSKYPDADIQVRATAALMAIETLCYEKAFSEAVERAESFKNEFSQTPEAPLGYYWIAMALAETGNQDQALAMLEEIIEARFPTEARFKNVDVTTSARRLAAKIYRAKGDVERAKVLDRANGLIVD